MFCTEEHEPHAVLASVHGWDVPFWIDCGRGALSVRELTALILDGFAKQVPVWLPSRRRCHSLVVRSRCRPDPEGCRRDFLTKLEFSSTYKK